MILPTFLYWGLVLGFVQCQHCGNHIGRQIHARVVRVGDMFNVLVPTTLIHCYASNKDVVSGRKVFDEMPMRNSVTWNAMITGYCSQSKKTKDFAFEAALLFKDMLVDFCGVKPTDTTMVCVLSSSSQLGVLEIGACVHGYIEKTIYMPENDLFIGTGLVDMYSKCGCLDSTLSIFRHIVMGEKVGKILLQLQPESISEDLTGTSEDYVALSNVYASAGRWQEVESLRKEMKVKRIKNELGCSLVQTTKTP
ncbi:hypothetical protein Q3G72_020584 [Acer saccharum]|nr:hypothetical protein Q3G72_020584 [Acer saccharum]